MLPRVLEPEVMDTPDEAIAYDAMDHAEVNGRFVADVMTAHGPPRGGEWLDVGTGTALIPIALCRAAQNVRLVAVDLAEYMLALARSNVERAGLTDRIRLDRVDAKGLTYPDGSFEAVLSNSIVHHVPDPLPALAEMARLVAPGGTLFVRDLARPPDLETLDRLVSAYAGSEPEHARSMFRDSLHAALAVEEVRDLIRSLGLPVGGVRMTSDRHWTLTWRRPH
ncbi:class I SAM-dependent methyltransferase [Tautonia plasticadhaerens]|uniref:Demethylrebeccamycin-D-glucose O-methyltransferase n=1 Tax=Tautonia plasticadhaerens TaxID=2527974 RepID=A0A518GY40_9BACT|nr:class I SAM-dependent methyltransferase [Tautonia plasticadhaerens]QDV33514.1 Demethylrebeccamycin-D-glucose O-methyltransferase [Tautonia plasticadhaerens]